MLLIKKLSYKLSAWSYVVYAGSASFIVALKGFLYAHLLSSAEYALFNYYLLVLGFGVLAVGSGVIIRCHIELPLIVENDAKLRPFVEGVKRVGALSWGLLSVGVIAYSLAVGVTAFIWLPALIQVIVYFLFTVDLLVTKSRAQFLEYARQLFFRNALIALAGLVGGLVTAKAEWAIMCEAFMGVVLYRKGLYCFIGMFGLPSWSFVSACMKYVPVTLVGASIQYADRLLAAYVMPIADFSRFSYLSLCAMVGLALQQLINTRVITLLPAVCERDPRQGFLYVLRVSGAVFFVLLPCLSFGLWILQNPWFSASWISAGPLLSAFFLLAALFRSSDFFSTYLLVMGKKNSVVAVQSLTVLLFTCYGLIYAQAGGAPDLTTFMSFVAVGFFASWLGLVMLSWRASLG
ncbi:hypothetical protein [Pseudomonas sp. nanlin1]|uniref:hypothetical protein n=1 Tax=Pseudomonas sp. nanlin1 TaxID=3040605 RepID=UPI00388EC524